MNILTSKLFIINSLISLILVHWSFTKLEPLIQKTKEDKERDLKYPCFSRGDMHKIRRPIFYIMAPTLFPRFLSGYGGIAVMSVFVILFSFTHVKGTPYTGW